MDTSVMRELKPSENMHLKDIHSGDIYEGTIYLGIYDSPENYVEVTEEEYQAYLNRDVDNEATEEDLYGALAELGVSDD